MEMMPNHYEEDFNFPTETSQLEGNKTDEDEQPPLSKLLSSSQVFLSGRFSIRGLVPNSVLNDAIDTFSSEVYYRKKYFGSEISNIRIARLNHQLRRLQVMLSTRYANAVGEKNLFEEKQKVVEQTTILTCALNAEDSLNVLTAEMEIRNKEFKFPEIVLQRTFEDLPTDSEADISNQSTSSSTDISEF